MASGTHITERILNSAIDWAALMSESDVASSLRYDCSVSRHRRTMVRLNALVPGRLAADLDHHGSEPVVLVQLDDEAAVGLLEHLEQLVGDLRQQVLDVERLGQGGA